MSRISLNALLLVLFSSTAPAQSIFFVDKSASGAADGSSWVDAYRFVQDALSVVSEGDHVWIAAGTYYPDEGTGRSIGDQTESFAIPEGVSVIGGFTGDETVISERDLSSLLTVLSGDLLGNDGPVVHEAALSRLDNSNNVVIVRQGQGSTTPILDGVVVRSGHAISTSTLGGGGVYVFPDAGLILRNSLLQDNYARTCGGGISALGSLDVRNSTFENNAANSYATFACVGGNAGGAIATDGRAATGPQDPLITIRESDFRNNNGYAGCGGAGSFGPGRISIVRSVFLNNRAYNGGALCFVGVHSDNGALIANITAVGNVATDDGGGVLIVDRSDVTVVNSLFHHNVAIEAGARAVGGVAFCYEPSSLVIASSTLAYNRAPSSGAISTTGSCSTSVSNSIMWGNSSNDDLTFGGFNGPASGTVVSSIVGGGMGPGVEVGSDVLNLDPKFKSLIGPNRITGDLDDNYRLHSTSAAIDVGDNSIVLADIADLDDDGVTTEMTPLDLDEMARFVVGTSGSAIVDLGAFENTDFVTSNEEPRVTHSPSCGIAVFPNPMSSHGEIVIEAAEQRSATSIAIDLIDGLGRLVRRVPVESSKSRIGFDVRSLASGRYVLRASAMASQLACQVSLVVVR